jgi:putative hemolysin
MTGADSIIEAEASRDGVIELAPTMAISVASALVSGFLCAGFAASLAPGPVTGSPAPPALAQRANPASQHCIAKGGTLSIQRNGIGAEYGVCVFPDNRQCEEWAMLRGGCPVGGIRVTGYVTAAARYCAITGGQYTVRGRSNSPEEQGACDPRGRHALRCRGVLRREV